MGDVKLGFRDGGRKRENGRDREREREEERERKRVKGSRGVTDHMKKGRQMHKKCNKEKKKEI